MTLYYYYHFRQSKCDSVLCLLLERRCDAAMMATTTPTPNATYPEAHEMTTRTDYRLKESHRMESHRDPIAERRDAMFGLRLWEGGQP